MNAVLNDVMLPLCQVSIRKCSWMVTKGKRLSPLPACGELPADRPDLGVPTADIARIGLEAAWLPRSPQFMNLFGTQDARNCRYSPVREVFLSRTKSESERRQWIRLPLAIPVFVRSRDENGKEFLEFATALNVSPGGALIAVRRPLPPSAKVSLEIPSAPLASSIEVRKAARNLQARILRSHYSEGFHLLGIKFAHSLLNHNNGHLTVKRKVVSSL